MQLHRAITAELTSHRFIHDFMRLSLLNIADPYNGLHWQRIPIVDRFNHTMRIMERNSLDVRAAEEQSCIVKTEPR